MDLHNDSWRELRDAPKGGPFRFFKIIGIPMGVVFTSKRHPPTTFCFPMYAVNCDGLLRTAEPDVELPHPLEKPSCNRPRSRTWLLFLSGVCDQNIMFLHGFMQASRAETEFRYCSVVTFSVEQAVMATVMAAMLELCSEYLCTSTRANREMFIDCASQVNEANFLLNGLRDTHTPGEVILLGSFSTFSTLSRGFGAFRYTSHMCFCKTRCSACYQHRSPTVAIGTTTLIQHRVRAAAFGGYTRGNLCYNNGHYGGDDLQPRQTAPLRMISLRRLAEVGTVTDTAAFACHRSRLPFSLDATGGHVDCAIEAGMVVTVPWLLR
ncbi:hypothetical protein HPB50_028434 [Hyalomma asiaticum]|nr:hypothetical protein HPB50_028434 [Hyalomma asiaticum]